MIDRQSLLADLQKLLQRLEADLLQRSESAEVPEVGQRLREEYERAKKAERTAQNYEDWRSDAITQAAAAWVLSCVFMRFLEDNRLIDPPKIAGPGKRLQQARDEWELYLGQAKQPNERDYLLSAFDELARLPGTKEVFGPHNPIREMPNWLSGDGAREMLAFFQKIDANSAESNKLIHDFTDPAWETRFLGDLYQDLSEAARKKYALLQTPEFVEEFILDRTLERALNEFGRAQKITRTAQQELPGVNLEGQERLYAPFRMIDPACGSGHFLLGSFRRILDRWQRNEPGTNIRDLVQRTLDSIHGVDINPYAVAIARFRLLLVAMKACNVTRLADAPAFHFTLVCGDSLLHGTGAQASFGWHDLDHAYQAEDHAELVRILKPGHYHAVVANPPYITPKDKALNDAYRERYSTCHRQYSLAIPFMQRLFQLAVSGYGDAQQRGGFVGQITANSFMKREFGKKLIEEYFAGRDGIPGVDLTHVIDTAGAYIPGHSTPTVILFGRNRAPVAKTIRTVMGIRGEPSTPDDPARGLVWSAILTQIDQPGSQSQFVSVSDSLRELFHTHPWSIGGGGASDMKQWLDANALQVLSSVADDIGFCAVTREDEVYQIGNGTVRRNGIVSRFGRPLVEGGEIRDWQIIAPATALWPYNDQTLLAEESAQVCRFLWHWRVQLSGRTAYGTTQLERGLRWFEYSMFFVHRYRTHPSIALAIIATHNHFFLERGTRLFKDSVVVIKLPVGTDESEYMVLLGLLNSSTACFWMKQVCFPKGTAAGDISKEKGKAEANRFAFNATALGNFPLPRDSDDMRHRVAELARTITQHGDEVSRLLSQERLSNSSAGKGQGRLRDAVDEDRRTIDKLKGEMVFLQEELDWTVYAMYGLTDSALIQSAVEGSAVIAPTDRPFCSGVPSGITENLRSSWARRRKAIEEIPTIRLIETPVYKRPWTGRQGVYGTESRTVAEQQSDIQVSWMLDRLEGYSDFDGRMNDQGKPTAKLDVSLTSVARLADVARQDPDFMQVGELYRKDPAFDVQRLVADLVEAESVPLLPVLRYKATGLRKRAEWEQTWELQREEDRTGKRLDIPLPPRYTSADFLNNDCWRLRGKLDVPKERWVSFPHCEGPDGTPMIAWAGYDHLQLARAISTYFVDIQERLGGRDDPRLVPLLACLLELVPWLKQWHNEPDTAFDGMRMGDYFEGFINEEARQLGKTVPEIKAWEPPKRLVRRSRRP